MWRLRFKGAEVPFDIIVFDVNNQLVDTVHYVLQDTERVKRV